MRDIPSAEAAELTTVLCSYGLTAEESAPVVMALRKRPEAWVDFMMRFELGIERPNPRRVAECADNCRGLCRWWPHPTRALYRDSPSKKCARIFRHRDRRCTNRVRIRERTLHGAPPLRSALYTALIGGLAATAAFLVARAIV